MIAFSWGLDSFKNFKYVASISASFDADLLAHKGKDKGKSGYQSHELPHHPAKVARYPFFDCAGKLLRVLRSESLVIYSSLE